MCLLNYRYCKYLKLLLFSILPIFVKITSLSTSGRSISRCRFILLLLYALVPSGTKGLHKISSTITIFCNHFRFLLCQSAVFYLNIKRYLPWHFWSSTLSATLRLPFQCLSTWFGGRISWRISKWKNKSAIQLQRTVDLFLFLTTIIDCY